MKLFLLFLVVSQCAVFGELTEPTNSPTSDELIEPTLPAITPEVLKYRETCLQNLNSMRREVAKLEQIANMNRLAYDDVLEQLFHQIDVCIEDRQPIKAGRLKDRIYLTYTDDDTFKSRNTRPGQYRVACFKKMCDDVGEVQVTMINVPTEHVTHGAPGSDCESGRSDDGLCIKKKPLYDAFFD